MMKYLISALLGTLLGSMILVGCSGGGNDAPSSVTDPPGPTEPTPPAQASLIYSTLFSYDFGDRPGAALIRSQTDGSGQVLLSDAPGLYWSVFVSGTTMEYQIFNDFWHIQTDGTGAHLISAGEQFDRTIPGWPPLPPIMFGSDYINERARVGDRRIYERCPLLPDQITAGQCDLYSVKTDGSDTVALGTTPQYEAFQGMSGSHVIIRRVEGATDTLYSIPITGGPETFLRTLRAHIDQFEFVAAIVGDRIIIESFHPGGISGDLLSIRHDGQDLTQLTDNMYVVEFADTTGAFVCYPALDPFLSLWCVPADGSTGAKKITDHGEFRVGVTP